MRQSITVEVSVNIPREKAWEFFTRPEHITKWNNASPDWECPRAGSDLKVGGTFSYRMQAKDGSGGFNFGGTFTEVVPNEVLAFTINGDKRKVRVTFETKDGMTHVVESFETENENPIELQRGGWQSILDNYRRYAEGR